MRAITYVMSHPAHLPYLIVSLRSLRRYWKGNIYVHAWPESLEFVLEIARDLTELCIIPVLWEPEHRKKNAQFESKQLVVQSMKDCELVLYLDADTLIKGDLTPLFDAAEKPGFLATQFGAWTTQGKIIQGRVKRLRQFPEINQAAVEHVLEHKWPSVNGGVFCCRPDSQVLRWWHEWTKVARSIFISDETVLHSLMPIFSLGGKVHAPPMAIYQGGAFNCSPRYQPNYLPDDQVKIWHFHGDCNSRPQKSKRAVELWWPEYVLCLHRNVGGVADWRKDVHHKFLDGMEEKLLAAGDDWPERLSELAQK